jgi:hypothetical protein
MCVHICIELDGDIGGRAMDSVYIVSYNRWPVWADPSDHEVLV